MMRRMSERFRTDLMRLRTRKLFSLASSKELRWAAKLGVFLSAEVESLLPDCALDLVLDVGSNRGQFALLINETYPEAKIYCFEPGKSARDVLDRVLSGLSISSEVCPYGLSSRSGTGTLFVTEADDSSSLYQPSDLQTAAHPNATVASTEVVDLRRGDEELDEPLMAGTVLLKLDVQGAELDALIGMGELLDSVDFILIELSISEMYAGQALATEVSAYLHESGFEFQKISSPHGFGVLQTQFDALFRNAKNGEGSTNLDVVHCEVVQGEETK